MINSIWLHTYKTLVETGHFTHTADKLFMTQPGVSQHIKKLEESIGFPLIKRFRKQFEVTKQGRLVYEYACQREHNEDELLESLIADEPHQGHCTLACSGSVALSLFPKLLELQQHHLSLTISLEAAPNQRILTNVKNGTIDVGIVTQKPNEIDFQFSEIGQQELHLIMPRCLMETDKRNHHNSNKRVLVEKLEALGLISHPDAMHYLTRYLQECGDNTMRSLDTQRLINRSYINQLTQILTPVSMGLGFTVLPASALNHFPEKETLYCHQAPFPVHETLYWVEKRYRELPARYEQIKEQCISL